MNSPTPRQQAGYLRRLLRRGEIQIFDPSSGRPMQALIELHGDTIRLTPVSPRPGPSGASTTEKGWSSLLERMRSLLSLEDAEELMDVIEAEHRKSILLESMGG